VERCPSCRARLNDSPLCPRCGCDLGLVLRAESQAQDFVKCGIQSLAAGNTMLAATQLETSLTLRRNPLAAALIRMLAARRAAAEMCLDISDQSIGHP
jgi:hypothetical protein